MAKNTDSSRLRTEENRESILTKAVVRAAEWLGVKGGELAEILGTSSSSASRMKSGDLSIKETDKAFELGAMLVRVYRSLYAIVGGDSLSGQDWLRRENTALRGVPIEQMKTIRGINAVCEYLDARRAVI